MNSTVLHRSSLNIIQIYLTFSSDLFYSGLKCTLSRHIYKSALKNPKNPPTFLVFCVENKRRSHRLHLTFTVSCASKFCIVAVCSFKKHELLVIKGIFWWSVISVYHRPKTQTSSRVAYKSTCANWKDKNTAKKTQQIRKEVVKLLTKNSSVWLLKIY